ncbi:glycosyltransferase [Halomonas sp. Bachu 37]|uniref:glycosyltransferase family 2 protein n=1 Tax=Halomonas kashgarensis TaxID=3084920 RepID=UPI0032164D77
MTHTALATHIQGHITQLAGNMVQGWVHDESAPQQQWAVAIMADGQLLALANADQYHPAAPGTGMHGFKVMLSDTQIQHSSAISLTLANHRQVLDTLRLPAQPMAEHTDASSRVQWQPGLTLRGWLVEPEAPHTALGVSAYEGERPVASAKPSRWTNHHNQYVQAAFTLTLPLSMANGEPHELTIKDSQGRELSGSPLVVHEWPQGLAPWVTQLVPKLPSHVHQLLKKQLDRYEQWLPRAVGFNDYPAWQKAFAPTASPRVTQPGTIGLLWLGEPTPQAAPAGKNPWGKQLKVRHYVLNPAEQGKDDASYQALLSEACQACDAVAQLESGDTLAENALALAWNALQEGGTQLVYSDFDMPEADMSVADSQARQPACLPAWDPERQWGQDYLGGGLCLVRSDLLKEAAHPATCFEEFSYAAIEALHAAGQPESAVVHLPEILRQRAKPWPQLTSDAQLARQQARLQRQDAHATLSRHEQQPGLYRLQRSLEQWPSVTLVIPTRDALALLRRCIDTLLEHTDYPGHVQLLVVDNNSQHPETHEYLARLRQRQAQPLGRGRVTFQVLEYPHPFNYAAINNAAVEQCDSELIALVNNDIEALHPEWLCNMAALLMRQGTGAVGAKLLWPNGMVQHGGVLGGQYGGLAGHIGNSWEAHDAGYLGMNQLTQRFSAVTAACLLLRRADYHAVGGLDDRAFPVAFNDVDLCLKLRRLGLNILWTPEARLIHAESATRGKDEAPEKAARAQREMDNLRNRWSTALLTDPAYNPNLGLDIAAAPYTTLALPPRTRTARTNALKR